MTTTICSGTVTALGQVEFDLMHATYAYIEIRRADGRILRAENVVVLNQVGTLLELGVDGRFFFDAARLKAGVIRQLFGIRRSDGRWAYDAEQVRVQAAMANILQGFIFSFVFVGLPVLAMGILQLIYSIGMARLREDEFFQGNSANALASSQQATIRI